MQQQHGVRSRGVYLNAAAARFWVKGVYLPSALQQRGDRDFVFEAFFVLDKFSKNNNANRRSFNIAKSMIKHI